jgi:hypothetical protein
MALLRTAGVLDAPPPPASPALIAARDTLIRLLAKWEPALVARRFDAQSLRYSFLRNLGSDFARMGQEHGACRADGDIVPLSRTHGHFRLACERGSIELTVYLTPHAAPVVQSVEYHQSLPVTDDAQSAARALVAALNGAPLPPALLAPKSDRPALEKRLARLRGNYGSCTLDTPLASDGREKSSFRLRCAEGALELTLRFEPQTSLVADVWGAEPRAYGAPCAQ